MHNFSCVLSLEYNEIQVLNNFYFLPIQLSKFLLYFGQIWTSIFFFLYSKAIVPSVYNYKCETLLYCPIVKHLPRLENNGIFCFFFFIYSKNMSSRFSFIEEIIFWSPRSYCIESWFWEQLIWPKRERVKGTGSLEGTEAVSRRMISIERVAVSEVWGYRFARQNLKKQKMK